MKSILKSLLTLRRIAYLVLTLMSVLSVFAIYWDWGWFTRLFIDLGTVAGALCAVLAYRDIKRTVDSSKIARYFALWGLPSAICIVLMLICLFLCDVALMGSEFYMSVASGLVPALMPGVGIGIGYYIRSRTGTGTGTGTPW